MAAIAAVNANPKLTYAAALNAFTDMTAQQRAKVLGPRKKSESVAAAAAALAATAATPAQILAEEPPAAPAGAGAAMAAAPAAHLSEAAAARGVTAEALATAPPDWSTVLPAPKFQDTCGSCW